MKIDLEKNYTIQSGSPVRIICVNGPGDQPVVGFHDDTLCQWGAGGSFMTDGEESCMDLKEVQPRIQRTDWLSIFCDGQRVLHQTRTAADRYASRDGIAAERIACIKIETDVAFGEGLEDE